MIKEILNNFIFGLKPFIIISLIIGIFIGIISLAMISDIFWWFCVSLCMIFFIYMLGKTRNNKE